MRIKKRLLVLSVAAMMLCCGPFTGCTEEIDIDLKTVYIVFPNRDPDEGDLFNDYVTCEVSFRTNSSKEYLYYSGLGKIYGDVTVKVLYEGEEKRYVNDSGNADGAIIGYDFAGIYDRREGGNRICYDLRKVTADDVEAMTTNGCYYARYNPIPFIIKFDSGEGSSISDKTVLYDTTLTSFDVPVLPSVQYVFDGWYSDSGLTDRVTDANGNILLTKQQFNAANYQLSCLQPYSSRYTNSEMEYIVPEEYSSTLYAKYVEKMYTVEFDCGYGREEMNAETTVVGGSVLEDLLSPEKDGYKVAEWSYDTDGYVLYDGEQITGDTVLHAVWRRYKYVDLWSNGEKVKNLLVYYGFVYYPATSDEFSVERDGYRLAGWYTSPSFEAETQITVVNFEDSYTALYAKWEPVS